MNPPVTIVLRRALGRRCPRCGDAPIFRKFYTLHARCTACGFDLQDAAGDGWAFMYLSTGFLTGLIIIGMLLITPPSLFVGRVVLIAVCLVAFGFTLPWRKSMVIALGYLIDRATSDA